MNPHKLFTFSFDEGKTRLVRAAIDERAIFAKYTTQSIRTKIKPSAKITKETITGYDSIYVALDRIDDTLHYINSMELGSKRNGRGAFDFYDFLNNMYVVIHCIKTLAIIFNVPPEQTASIEKSTDCFYQVGLDGKGADGSYFEYIRSLASVHPAETGRHPSYHGYGNIHCSPFAVWSTDRIGQEGDVSLLIYRTDSDDIQILPLYICQFEKYLKRWIDFIDRIVDAVNAYNDTTAAQYAATAIDVPAAFASYPLYISNLKDELCKRTDSCTDYILENYERVFSVELTNASNAPKLLLYQNAIKYSLGFLHQRLQHMDNDDTTNTGIISPDHNYSTELYIELWKPRCFAGELGKSQYALEKLYYIDGSGSYNEQYARRLLEPLVPIINKYVVFSNTEPAFETQLLVSMALYFECLNEKCLLNRNIPNSLQFREHIISTEAWADLHKKEPPICDTGDKLQELIEKFQSLESSE